MDPRALVLHAAGSSKPAGASAEGAVQQAPAPAMAMESRPDKIPVSGAPSQAISNLEVPSQVLGKEITPAEGSSSSPFGGGQREGKAVVVDTDAAARIQAAEVVDHSFALIHDVKAMLHTGRFEGQQIAYKNKRRKLTLLHGVIHGTSYFCTCGDHCGHNGKALSARAFEHHAVKDGRETNNPNDHIILSSSNVSLFEACRKLKDARNKATMDATIDSIVKSNPEAVRTQNDNSSLMDIVHNLEKRMEKFDNTMESLLSRLDAIEKNIDFISKEMHRHQELFQDLSKIMGKFVDDK